MKKLQFARTHLFDLNHWGNGGHLRVGAIFPYRGAFLQHKQA